MKTKKLVLLAIPALLLSCNDPFGMIVKPKIAEQASINKSNDLSHSDVKNSNRMALPTGLLSWSPSLGKWAAPFTSNITLIFTGPYPLPTNGTKPVFHLYGITGASSGTSASGDSFGFSLSFCQSNVVITEVAFPTYTYDNTGETIYNGSDSKIRKISTIGGGSCPTITGSVIKICEQYYAVETGYSEERDSYGYGCGVE